MISPNSQAKGPVYAVVISEKGGAERREVFEATELSVGRVQGNDLMLPKGNVSKRHARLLYRDGRFIVTDLNSTNGTYVNRRRISQATIVREGDRIYIGDFVLRIELMGAPDSSPGRVSSGPVPAPPTLNSDPPRVGSESQPTLGRLASSKPADSPVRAAMQSHPDDELSAQVRLTPVHAGIPSAERTVSTTREDTDTHAPAIRRYLEKVFERVAQDLGCGEEQPQASSSAQIRVALERHLRELGDPPAGTTLEQARQSLEAEFLDVGPLRALLDDASVKQIVVSRSDRIVVASDAGRSPLTLPFSTPLSATWALARLCQQSGISLGATVEGRLPDGSRLSALQSSGAGGPVISIQRARPRDESLEQLVRRGTISRAIATFLHQCLAVRSNVLVVGTHDSGAEAVLCALCQTADDATLLAVESFEELVPESNRVRRISAAAPDVDLPELFRMAGRMPSTRLVIDITAPRVATDALHSISEGCDGVLAYLPATSFRRALQRLSASLAVECAGLAAEQARDWIAASFDLVLEVARLRDGRSRVLRVAELTKLDDPQGPGQDIFTFLVERTAAGGAVEGAFSPSGVLPKVLDELAMRGVSIDTSLFTRPPSR